MRSLLSSTLSIALVAYSLVAARELTGQWAGAAQATASSVTDPTVKADLGAKLDELITRYTPYGFSGAALVAKNGEVALHKAYGLANRSSGGANTLDTVFEIGSLTKTFTATAILQLEAQGRLGVNDSIGKHLDGVPPDKAAITIYHLLSHTSGLTRDMGSPEITPNVSRDELIRLALSAPLQFAPGQKYSYSNLGFIVLAAIIETASGKTWQDYLRERLFKPAGLTRTGFWDTSMTNESRVAVGYRGPSEDLLETASPEPVSWSRGMGATGVLSSVGDFYKWWLSLQKNGILSEDARKKMFTAPAVGDEPYGWHIEKVAGGPTRIHKGGVVQTFEAQFAYYPEAGVVMIFAMNKNISMRAPLWNAIERVVFGKDYTLPPAAMSAVMASDVTLQKYAGEYELPSGGKFHAWIDKNRLTIGAFGQDAVNLLAYPGNSDPQLHRDTNAMTEKVIEALKKGEIAGLKEAPDPAPAQRFWQGVKGRLGAVKSYQVLGTMPRAPGVVQTYARIEFEGGTEVIRFSWSAGKLGPMGGGIPLPAITRFIPQSENTFAAFDYRASQIVRVAFNQDAGGNISGLSVLSKDGKGDVIAKRAQEQWRSLFDGKSLKGWKANVHPESFSVVDGVIRARSVKDRSHLFFVGDKTDGFERFKNFELEATARGEPKSNSGIFFHTDFAVRDQFNHLANGYEVQLNSSPTEARKSGSLYAVVDLDKSPVDEMQWFKVHLTVQGKRIVVRLNGQVVVDYTEPEQLARPPERAGRRLNPAGGAIALQAHDPDSTFYFKDIRIRPLP